MDLKDKMRFALSTVPLMAEYTLPYVASVIGLLDSQRGEHVGSGVRCILGGRPALVTALHVLEQARAGPYAGFAISAGFGVPPYPVAGKVTFDRDADLAVYFLPEDYPQGGPVAFWPEVRIAATAERRATDYLFVHGFPGVRSYSSSLLQGVVLKSLPYGAMQVDDSEQPEALDPDQFAVYFDPRAIRVQPGEPAGALPDPHAMSGCPVWRIGASGRPAKDWNPDWSLLVGIVTQWRADAEVLIATSASKLLALASGTRVAGVESLP